MEEYLNNLEVHFKKSNMEVFEITSEVNLSEIIYNIPDGYSLYSTTESSGVVKIYVEKSE